MSITMHFIVQPEEEGLRLDSYLAGAVEDASRSFLKKIIKNGSVTAKAGVCTKPAYGVSVGEDIRIELPDPVPAEPTPENIPIEILYEDEALVVVNKEAGMVVHPAPGHETGTLVNALLHHCAGYQHSGGDVKRPGIVHRLDRDTSGVMVAAKTQRAYGHLARQAAEHAFDRRYVALARGEFKEQFGCINASLGRSLVEPSRMAVTGINARDAVTHFETLERFGVACFVRLRLETGRTHQIRVHLRFAGHPILGDPVYGETRYQSWNVAREVLDALQRLTGQALHAELLGFEHPYTGQKMTFFAEPPQDFQEALMALRTLVSPLQCDSGGENNR
ncbi:MAG: Ribosomal large subunit pseudouridine synthase D [Bacteroidetes bacterium ADurb.Bin123]|nr:MAG: Ribosomal large subunit pseudouridine synthase D [Bacteroidetes bacterium ADurb.Bin123]HOC68216.1 RluA family pseudouridine synthase [Candidatus Hydrogenedentota bacterium]